MRPRGAASVVLLVLVGGIAAWTLARPAPVAPGAARLASPEVLLAIFDTVWLVLAALPATASWPEALTRLAVGAPFHLAIAAAAGASPQFHAAWGLAFGAFAAVGTIAAHGSGALHGVLIALLAFAMPLAAFAAGDLGGVSVATVRPFLLASPLVAPTLLARGAPSVLASDGLPAVLAAAVLLAAHLAAGRKHGAAA